MRMHSKVSLSPRWIAAAGFAALPAVLTAALVQQRFSQRERHSIEPPGTIINVEGQQLHLIIKQNRGTQERPPIVVEAGMGSYAADWLRVLPLLDDSLAVYAYDRPGYAWSTPAESAPTAVQIGETLKTLLDAEGITQPALFVGHSYGAMAVRSFAHRYPERVAGVVLVDAAHEAIVDRVPDFLRLVLSQVGWLKYPAMLGASLGVVRMLAKATAEVDKPRYPGEIYLQYPAAVRDYLITPRCWTEYTRTTFRELECFQESCKQIAQQRLLNPVVFGDKPLAVLMASTQRSAERFQQAVPFPAESYDREWRAMQTDLLELSTNSRFTVAEASGHLIMAEQPTAIVEAIQWVLSELGYSHAMD